jgi:hypothetical protein
MSQVIVNGDIKFLKSIADTYLSNALTPISKFLTLIMLLQLCFELLECLLERYPSAVAPLVSFAVSFLYLTYAVPLCHIGIIFVRATIEIGLILSPFNFGKKTNILGRFHAISIKYLIFQF